MLYARSVPTRNFTSDIRLDHKILMNSCANTKKKLWYFHHISLCHFFPHGVNWVASKCFRIWLTASFGIDCEQQQQQQTYLVNEIDLGLFLRRNFNVFCIKKDFRYAGR